MTMIELMTLPFLECLVLVGIHSYLGIHVLRRKVIFVDLAFAQIAALGTTVAYLFELHPTSPGAYVFSLAFTFLAAALFAITRLRDDRIPQEAVIGLTYALAASVAILVIDRAPHGAEHIKEIMAGSILWVRASDVGIAAAVYLAVGLFHFLFRDRFLLVTTDAEEAARRGINVRLWDFLFYMSFGLVISLSVRVAGVLLVFVFLIVPAMLGMLLTSNLRLQLLIGWVMGTLVSMAGLALSDLGDFPAGPAVVSFYGIVLVITALIVYIVQAALRPAGDGVGGGVALLRVSLGAVVVTLCVGTLFTLGNSMARSDFWARNPYLRLHNAHQARQQHQPPAHSAHQGHEHQHHPGSPEPEPGAARPPEPPSLAKVLEDMDITEKEAHLAAITDVERLVALVETAHDDEELTLALGKRILQLCKRRGTPIMLAIMRDSSVPLFRSDALDLLVELSGDDFGYDPFTEPDTPANQTALAGFAGWTDQRFPERKGRARAHKHHGPGGRHRQGHQRGRSQRTGGTSLHH